MTAPTIAHERVRQATAAVLTFTLYDQYGDPDDDTTGVTVGIDQADGTEVVAAGTSATDVGSTSPGQWTYTLTVAQTASLDLLTAVWKDGSSNTLATTYHEIVGGYYFTEAEFKALFPQVKVDAARFREVRTEIERLTEDHCGVAFVPRYARERYDGTGTPKLYLDRPRPRTVASVRVYTDSTTYTSFTATELAELRLEPWGVVRENLSVFTAGRRNILIEYEHGYDRPPDDLRRELMTLARHRINMAASSVPDRTLSFTTPEGETHRQAVPGLSRWTTGIPSVDEALNRYSEKVAAA